MSDNYNGVSATGIPLETMASWLSPFKVYKEAAPQGVSPDKYIVLYRTGSSSGRNGTMVTDFTIDCFTRGSSSVSSKSEELAMSVIKYLRNLVERMGNVGSIEVRDMVAIEMNNSTTQCFQFVLSINSLRSL